MTKTQRQTMTTLRSFADDNGRVDMDALFAADAEISKRTLRALERRGLVVLGWTTHTVTKSWNGTHYPTTRQSAINSITIK